MQQKKKELEDNINQCEQKLIRAEKLIGGLPDKCLALKHAEASLAKLKLLIHPQSTFQCCWPQLCYYKKASGNSSQLGPSHCSKLIPIHLLPLKNGFFWVLV